MTNNVESSAPSVFFLVPPGAGSGEERQAFLHLSMARQAGSSVHAAMAPDTWFARQCRASDVNTFVIGSGFGAEKTLQKAVASTAAKLLHGFGAAGAALALKLGRALDLQTIVSLSSPGNSKAVRRASRVLVPDGGCLRALERAGLPPDRLVHHGLAAPDQSRIGSHTRASARAALKLADNQIALFAPGPLHADMGQDVLLEALASVEDPRLRVSLTGTRDSEFARAIDIQAAQHAATAGRMLGRLDDPSLLQAFDLCVAPIKSPHACHHVLAALSSGLPVVTNPIGAMNDLIEDGESGMFAVRDNAAGIARVLERALQDPDDFQRMGKNARKRFRAHCSMRRCARRYCALLDELATPETAA